MKKWLLILVLTLVPTFALAAELRSGDSLLSLSSSEVIKDDVYSAASTVDARSTIEGDLTVAGGTINIDGEISGDVFAAGGTIILSGEVADDVRIAGGTLTISGIIGDDLLITGGEINITESAVINGQVYLAGGKVVIAGKTGSIDAAVGALVIEKTAAIAGDLSYRSEKEAVINTGATIAGETTFNLTKTDGAKFAFAGSIIWWLTGFILAGLLMMLLPNKVEKLAKSWKKDFWMNTLTGLIFAVALPVAAGVLMFTIVGIPVAVGLLMLMPILVFIAKLVAVVTVGYWIHRLLTKKADLKPTWLSVLIGAIALTVAGLIPFIGWAAIFVVFLASLGALIRYDWNLLKTLRQNKSL